MAERRIIWITADSFVDTDRIIVPYFKNVCNLNVDWYIIKGHNKNIEIGSAAEAKIINLNYRERDIRIIAEYRGLFNSINLDTADMIYSDYMGIPFYYPILFSLRRDVPVVHAAHNVIPYKMWPLYLRLGVKMIFHFNHHFQLFSKFTYKWFKEHYPQKSAFYAPMIVKDFGEAKTDKYPADMTKVNLLFFGNVRANKRLDLLIDAVKDLPKEIKYKVQLNIYGECLKDKDKYLKQIGNYDNINAHFQRTPDEEIPELFTKHQFLMLPYQDVAQSGPHMIAYNYGLPVIASNIEGFAERVEDGSNGFLFKSGDKQSLIEVITKAVMLKQEEYQRMRDDLSRYVTENYSLEAVASRYLDFFNTLLGNEN